LTIAKQWARTAAANGTLANQFVRRATVLLGDIAMAMDRDDEVVTNYTAVINLKNQFREQPAAYAHLLELLMLRKQDDLVEQWVRHGQAKFEGTGGLELDFLREAAKTLKRRNHPLWNELDQQIVDLTPEGKKGKLPALRELASNARKFGRYAEAETNYVAICAMPLKSAEETVNAHLMLAEVQAKQNKDITPTLQLFQSKAAAFTNSVDREYATYRLAKFYEEQGNLASAGATYQSLASSASTSTWAAASLHQLAALKEKQGDLQAALQFYRQYPLRFPGQDRMALQALGRALNVAEMLGDTSGSEQIAATLTNRAAAVQDYNLHLHLAFYFKNRGKQEMATGFLESGLVLAQRAASLAANEHQRYWVHFQVLRRLNDFSQFQRMLDYMTANASDFSSFDANSDDLKLQCYCYKSLALYGLGEHQPAVALLTSLLEQAHNRSSLSVRFSEILGLFFGTAEGSASASRLFEAAAENYPNDPWVNIGRLEVAIKKFNAGDFSTAQRLADQITNTLSENAKMTWVRNTYWGAVYLHGCCLVAQGSLSEGENVKQLALAKQADLGIQGRLRRW
jgi:tetratricopeptide (TPR) repeat protein